MADQPHNHIPNISYLGSLLVWVGVSLIGGSLAVLKRSIPMKQAAFYLALASFVGPSCCYGVFAFWPQAPWYIGVPICGACSLTIVGIALLIDKANAQVGKLDPSVFIPEKYRPTPPPKTGKVEVDESNV